jgi:hypothetical protein
VFGFHYEEREDLCCPINHLNPLADSGIECYWIGGESGGFEAPGKKGSGVEKRT